MGGIAVRNRILRLESAPGRPWAGLSAAGLLLLLVLVAVGRSLAQVNGTGLTPGEPIISTTTTQANSSSITLDATQFSGGDPCAKVAAACSFATNTLPVSIGMDIDARAFASTGSSSANTNQVCSVANAQAMLSSCTFGGKVLLGPYTLWLPLSPTSGTPPGAVLVLPNNFGGFRGVSRGSLSCHDTNLNCTGTTTPTSTGSVIAACTGTNTPVSGCTAPSSSRIWAISSTVVSTVGATNYIKINSSGMNLAAGEPVRIDQSSTANNNGAWRVCAPPGTSLIIVDPNCPAAPTSSVVYVVGASSSTSCSSSCGSIYGEIPLIDVGPAGSATFAQRVENVTIDCVGVPSCVPIRSLSGNEQSGFRDVQLTGSLERAFDVHTFNAQNGGPLIDLQISPGTKIGGTGQTPCGAGTTGFFAGENGARQLGGNITIDMANCANIWAPGGNTTGPVTAGAYVDTTSLAFEIGNLHCENTEKCILIGQDNQSNVVSIHDLDGMIANSCKDSGHTCTAQTGAYSGGPSSVIDISGNFASTTSFTGHYKLGNIRKSSAGTTLVEDNVLGINSTDSFMESYEVDRACAGGTCTNTLFTTSPNLQSIIPTGFSIPQGTLTASSPFISQSATWNSGATAFTNLLTNVTNTAAAAGSLLVNHEVGGSSVWNLDPTGTVTQSGNFNLSGSSPNITTTVANASLHLTPNGSGLVTAPTPPANDNSTNVATTAYVQAQLPHVAGKAALTGQNSNQSGTVVASPATGTYMLALCVWIQTTGNLTVTATVSYNNGTISTSDSSSSVSAGSTSNRSCTVISEHIASGTAVTYSTSVGGGGIIMGSYGLDIVETQVQ